MAKDPASYIAWDGKRYSGEPPTGWFLAADNRWWPNKTLVDAGQGQPIASPEEVANTTTPRQANSGRSTQTSTSYDNRIERRQPPRQPPRPKHRQPAAPPSSGQRPPPARTSQHAKRHRSLKIKRVLFVVGILWFLFSVASAVVTGIAEQSGGELASPAVETTVGGVAAPQVAGTTGTDTPSPTTNFTSNDINFRATGCGPGVITGMLDTQRSDAEAVDLAFEILVDSEPPQTAVVTRNYGRLEPGQAQPMMAPLPAGITTFDCEVVSVTITPSPRQG